MSAFGGLEKRFSPASVVVNTTAQVKRLQENALVKERLGHPGDWVGDIPQGGG